MQHYNDYQKAEYQARYGSDKVSREKRYDLFYNGQRLVTNQPYPVCSGKQSKLLREQPNNYQKKLFAIELHK
jgi:hypothetical protein